MENKIINLYKEYIIKTGEELELKRAVFNSIKNLTCKLEDYIQLIPELSFIIKIGDLSKKNYQKIELNEYVDEKSNYDMISFKFYEIVDEDYYIEYRFPRGLFTFNPSTEKKKILKFWKEYSKAIEKSEERKHLELKKKEKLEKMKGHAIAYIKAKQALAGMSQSEINKLYSDNSIKIDTSTYYRKN